MKAWRRNVKGIVDSRRAHYLARIGIFLVTAALIAGMTGCAYNPPPSQNLEIRTWYDLDAVRNNLAGNHKLMNNLDASTPGYEELAGHTANGGKGWEPIGFTTPGRFPTGFWGTFDGQGHEIRGLFIDRPDEICVGLFGVTGKLIRDVLVVDATVTGNWGVGGLVGWNEHGSVYNCYCSGEITGDERVGGLVGNNCGPVNNSYFVGNVSGNSMVGGLAGFHYGGNAGHCHSTGSVTGREQVGGLVGLNQGIVVNSYSTSSVTGNEYVGGLVGRAFLDYESGIVSNSLWDTETSGQVTSDGGTGETTAQMKNIATFTGAGWNIIAVADINMRETAYVWNIVDGETYPFLSWQP